LAWLIGLIKGRKEKTAQIILNCARKGISKEDIADITNLSAEEVAIILKKQIE
jgi:DNA-directed RNA polymerase specialized sigma24 family protein